MPHNESIIQLRRISSYFSAEFPDAVSTDYLKDFDSYPADVLTEAIGRILDRSSHLARPPTRSDVRETIQRVYEKRAQNRKMNTPTISGLKPDPNLKPEQRKAAQESIALIQRLYLQKGSEGFLPPDELADKMDEMGTAHGGDWTAQAAAFRNWLRTFRRLPKIRPGNLHPLPDVDARMRPERYRA